MGCPEILGCIYFVGRIRLIMKYDVFISYSSKDVLIAEKVCQALECKGITCWMAPKSLEPGKSYASEIVRGIKNSQIFVLVFSSNSNMSQHVMNEVDVAFNSHKRIVPFMIHDIPMSEDLSYYLSRTHWLVAYSDMTEAFNELTKDVCKYLGRESPAEDSCKKEDKNEDSPERIFLKGKASYSSLDYLEALASFKNAAERGHVTAQYNLGVMYSKGQGTIRNEMEAFRWFYQAAKQGDRDAQFVIGTRYDKGNGVICDKVAAVKWLRMSAESGNIKAQYALANKFYYGEGVSRNYQAALKWYKKAAKQNHVDAQRVLGCMFEYGQGVAQSDETAIFWYEMAAEQGNTFAIERLKELKKGKK